MTPGSPCRLAFVGQRTFFEACALGEAAGATTPAFFEFREGGDAEALRADLAAFGPDVTVVFRPEVLPRGALADLTGAVLGFLTEPLPRGGAQTNRDLDGRLWELRRVDRANVDRVVAFDPLVGEAAANLLPVWRCAPLPVADRFYADVAPLRTPVRPLFVGRSTPHREAMLVAAKHRFDLLHLAFGVDAERLAGLLDEHDVAINLHTDAFPSFENRVALHLAAGHLVISEPLEPRHGLEPGGDFLEARSGEDVVAALAELARRPTTWHSVRVRGRLAAERFRASRVWPRLVEDLRAELAVYGSERAAA